MRTLSVPGESRKHFNGISGDGALAGGYRNNNKEMVGNAFCLKPMYEPPKPILRITFGIVGIMMLVVGALELKGYVNIVTIAGFSLLFASYVI